MCLDGPLRFRLAVAGEDLPVVRLSWGGRACRLPGRCHLVPVLAGTLRHRPGQARRANRVIGYKTGLDLRHAVCAPYFGTSPQHHRSTAERGSTTENAAEAADVPVAA